MKSQEFKTRKKQLVWSAWKSEKWFLAGALLIVLTWYCQSYKLEKLSGKIRSTERELEDFRSLMSTNQLTEFQVQVTRFSDNRFESSGDYINNYQKLLITQLSQYYSLRMSEIKLQFDEYTPEYEAYSQQLSTLSKRAAENNVADTVGFKEKINQERTYFENNHGAAQVTASQRLMNLQSQKGAWTTVFFGFFLAGILLLTYSKVNKHINKNDVPTNIKRTRVVSYLEKS